MAIWGWGAVRSVTRTVWGAQRASPHHESKMFGPGERLGSANGKDLIFRNPEDPSTLKQCAQPLWFQISMFSSTVLSLFLHPNLIFAPRRQDLDTQANTECVVSHALSEEVGHSFNPLCREHDQLPLVGLRFLWPISTSHHRRNTGSPRIFHPNSVRILQHMLTI